MRENTKISIMSQTKYSYCYCQKSCDRTKRGLCFFTRPHKIKQHPELRKNTHNTLSEKHCFFTLSQRYFQQLKIMFDKTTNILGDQISKENLVYCFFGDRISIERQKLFSSISILSVRHHENISDKLKINNLYFMIFIVQINKVPKII